MDLQMITSVFIIIGIDIVLGGDNAIVIALACRNLPEKKRNKAILLGTILAILLRILLTILAVFLLKIPFLQFVGGCFLIFLAYHLLTVHSNDSNKIKSGITLAAAVRTIVLADLTMGLDNVIAVAGAAHGNIKLVFFGLFISIPIIIWGSKIILYLMERYPLLIYVGGGILSYTGGKMIIHENKLKIFVDTFTKTSQLIPIITVLIVLIVSILVNKLKWNLS